MRDRGGGPPTTAGRRAADLPDDGLKRVLEVLDGVPAVLALQFFLTPLDELDGARPLDALRAGQVEPVRQVAMGWVE